MWKKISCFSFLYQYPYTKQPRFQRGYVKLQNGGARVWVRVEMCHAFQLPRCNNVAMARSLVACCSRFLQWKDLRRNLDYHLCQVRNMWTKYFYYFQGLRGLKCYRTKSSVEMTFSSSTPLPPGFPESLTPPPPSCENFQNRIRRRGVNCFRNNPIVNTFRIYFSLLRSMFEMHTVELAPSVRELAKMKFKAQTPFLSLQNRNWRWSQRTSLPQDSCGPEFPVVSLRRRFTKAFGSKFIELNI